jgi:glycine cleavage system H protein
MEFPKDLRYTKDHEWARKSNGKVTIGITAFAVDQLGDITQVDLPDVGMKLEKGAAFGTIESVKSVSDLYTPVSGKVTKINEVLEDSPELVNESPYGKGWMIEIEDTGAGFDALLDHQAYTELVSQQE